VSLKKRFLTKMRKQAKASNKQLKLSQESQQQTNNVIESDKYE
jgi:hypothetical protein